MVPLCDHVPDWQLPILLGMVEARSVNVKNTTTTTHVIVLCYVMLSNERSIVPRSCRGYFLQLAPGDGVVRSQREIVVVGRCCIYACRLKGRHCIVVS